MNDDQRPLREANNDRSVVPGASGLSQIRRQIFDRTLGGVLLISLAVGLTTFVVQGISSPWYIRGVALALLIITIVVYRIRRAGQFVVAAYVLLLWLAGIVASMFLQAGTITSFTPYLFIPIVVITGLILGAQATYLITTFSALLTLGMIVASEQFSTANFRLLLPPFGLTMLTAWLVAQIGRYVDNLGSWPQERGKIPSERLERMQTALAEAENLRQRAAKLEQELANTQAEANRARRIALQKQKNLYSLISGMIQELNSSKKDLENIIQQLEDIVVQNEQTDSIDQAWHKLDYLSNLLINLEDMARLDNDEVVLDYRSVDVAYTIEKIVTAAQGLAREKNLEVRFRLPEDLPKVEADPVRLWQVLLHMLSNAVNFTDEGVIEVQAELTGQHELMIFISDTGLGMYREEMDLIFEKFGRGRGTLAKQRQGPGLGLAICKRIIELHGGRMWVSGVLGVGSTFYLTLPLSRAASPAQERWPRVTATTDPVPTGVFSQPASASPTPVQSESALVATLPADEPTLLLQAWPGPEATTKPSFGSPVSRFSPTYVERLTLTAVGLLLLIAGAVTVLAIVNGANDRRAKAPLEATLPSSGGAVAASVTKTPLPASGPTLTAIIAPTTTMLPVSATPTPLPTAAPVWQSTSTPTETAAPPTGTFTPSPTNKPSPTFPPSPTNTTTPAAVVEPEESTAEQILIQPSGTPSQQLSFFVDQQGAKVVTRFGPAGQHETDTTQTLDAVNNDRLSWSPSGRLLFTTDRGGNREIFVTEADGGQAVNLSRAQGDDMQPAWSPDGSMIAFSSGRQGNLDIYVMDADGGNPRQLTTSRGFDEWPVWSADGQHIAFVSDRTGNVEIYTMAADGGNQQRLTNHPAEDWPAAWSPDGSRLVFSSNRDSNWNLYVVDADGNNVMRLTNDSANERDPIWSADGRTIAFAYDGNANWDVYTIPAPTGLSAEIPRSAWTQVTNTPTNERYPSWIP